VPGFERCKQARLRRESAGVAPAKAQTFFCHSGESLDLVIHASAVREKVMKNLALKVRRFMVSEDGPTAVEYAVMLALIVIVCLTAISTIGTNANTTFDNVGQSIGGAS
jgi:pilus assembly protein Flp/PilA